MTASLVFRSVSCLLYVLSPNKMISNGYAHICIATRCMTVGLPWLPRILVMPPLCVLCLFKCLKQWNLENIHTLVLSVKLLTLKFFEIFSFRFQTCSIFFSIKECKIKIFINIFFCSYCLCNLVIDKVLLILIKLSPCTVLYRRCHPRRQWTSYPSWPLWPLDLPLPPQGHTAFCPPAYRVVEVIQVLVLC